MRKVITLSFLLYPGGVLLSGSPSGFGGHTILDIMIQKNPGDFKKSQATLNLFLCLVFIKRIVFVLLACGATSLGN